ncbi:MAG TPA: hypothetical protein VEB21_12635, partial [Terriglobales bacterium]|nr:hypothetical protein [Terriglobales bacterium]
MNAEAFARYEQARTAGDYRRAAGELTRVLEQADSGSAKDAGAALERLLLLFLDAQHYRRAGELLDRYQHHLAGQVSLLLRAAQVRVELDQLEQAAEAIDAALAAASDPDDRLRAAELLAEVGSFAQATALYRRRIDADAGDSAALAGLASLYLWRLEIGPARALAEKLLGSDPRSAPGQRILAAIAVLQGSYEEALGRLDLLLQQTAGDAEAHAWRAQALLCLGHNREAFGAASASVQHGHSFAALALQLLAGLGGRWRLRRHPRRFRRLRYGRGDWRTLWHDGVAAALRSLIDPGSGFVLQARQELAAELTAISPAAPAILAQRRAGSLAALLEEALIASGGNRSNPPTHIDSSGTLRRLPRSTSLRVASRRALELIKIASPEE